MKSPSSLPTSPRCRSASWPIAALAETRGSTKNLDAAIDWLKKAQAKFDAALDQCYGEQARTAARGRP